MHIYTVCVCIFLNNPLSWCSSDCKVSSCCPHTPCHISKNHTAQLKTTAAAFGVGPQSLRAAMLCNPTLLCSLVTPRTDTKGYGKLVSSPKRHVSIGLCRDEGGHGAVLSSSSSSLLFYCLNCERGSPHLIPGQESCSCSRV